MSNYSNSEATKTALIMAAGELFAVHGIDAVTTRAIAEKAGENIGIIHYHFGGKDGLLEAVIDFAGDGWDNDPLGTFLEEHIHLMKKSNGQNVVIAKMIEKFMSIIFSPEKPSWCQTIIFQIIQRDLDISRKISDHIGKPNLNALIKAYQTATDDHDYDRAYIWCIAILAPAVLIAVSPHEYGRISNGNTISDKFMMKLKASCINNALSSIEFLRKLKKISKSKNNTQEI